MSLDVDLERSYTLGAEGELAFSPLDALLGLDGSSTRLLELVVWAAGDLVEPAFRAGSATGKEIVTHLNRRFVGPRSKDLDALQGAAVTWLGDDAPDPTDKRGGEQLERALAVLTRLAAPAKVVADYDNKGGDTLFQLTLAFESNDLIALAAAETLVLGSRDIVLTRCRNCDRFFIAHRPNEIYCRRSQPGGPADTRKGCHVVGPQRRYAAQLSGADALYRRNYKRLDNRVRRGDLSRAALDQWRRKARAIVTRATVNELSDAEVEQLILAIEPEEI